MIRDEEFVVRGVDYQLRQPGKPLPVSIGIRDVDEPASLRSVLKVFQPGIGQPTLKRKRLPREVEWTTYRRGPGTLPLGHNLWRLGAVHPIHSARG